MGTAPHTDAAQHRITPCGDAAVSGEKLPLGTGGSDVECVNVREICSSCLERHAVLAVLDSPTGEYALCGRDAESRAVVLELPPLLAKGKRR